MVLPLMGSDLLAVCGYPGVILGGLDFYHSLRWYLTGHGLVITGLLKLILGEESTIRENGPLVLQVDDIFHLGFKGLADFLQGVGHGAIIGGFLDGRTG